MDRRIVARVFLGSLAAVLLCGCTEVAGDTGEGEGTVVGTGVIRACEHVPLGDCGPCYALETVERGSEVIELSRVGDLARAVDRAVRYGGTLDVLCTEMCPCQVLLFRVEVMTGTGEAGAR